jgi:ABC-type nitrate/sulfonate/bicarbonate transport system substrate-binding protein
MPVATIEERKIIKKSKGISEVVYTICGTLVASHVALQKGWLEKELKKVGVKLRYLRSLPYEKWVAHFNHNLPNFFRDGGSIPAIWAKSEGFDTKLVGLTFTGEGGKILVKTNSNLNKVSDLKGKKIGLYKRADTDRVDFWRATAERGILLALEIAGLKREDVEIVDLPVDGPDWASTEPVKDPAEFWTGSKQKPRSGQARFANAEIEALLEGRVDAIYHSRPIKLERDGKVKAIEDLGRYPDWTLKVNNSPSTITVNSDLAKKYPEIVIAYLRASIKAGRWINNNPVEAGKIFINVNTSFPCASCIAKALPAYNLIPNLSGKNVTGIEIEKQFLLEHGYIKNDFNVKEWVDVSFLEEALRNQADNE